MNTWPELRDELMRKAERASRGNWKLRNGIFVFAEAPNEDIQIGQVRNESNGAYIAAASPDVKIGLLRDYRALETKIQALETEIAFESR